MRIVQKRTRESARRANPGGRAGRVRRVPRRALDDPRPIRRSRRRRSGIIAEQRCNAEWALTQQIDVLIEQFDAIEDAYLRERKADVVQVGRARAEGADRAARASCRPADAEEQTDPRRARPVAGRRHPVQARTTSPGSSPISAASPRIPRSSRAASTSRRWSPRTTRGADSGERAPDRRRRARRRHRQSGPLGARGIPAEAGRVRARAAEAEAAHDDARRRRSTAHAVELLANIELPEDVEQALEAAPTGVGLFRTEFLFLEPRRAAERGRAVRGLPQRRCGDGAASRSRSAPSTSAPTSRRGPRRADARRAQSLRWACARSASAWPSRSCS